MLKFYYVGYKTSAHSNCTEKATLLNKLYDISDICLRDFFQCVHYTCFVNDKKHVILLENDWLSGDHLPVIKNHLENYKVVAFTANHKSIYVLCDDGVISYCDFSDLSSYTPNIESCTDTVRNIQYCGSTLLALTEVGDIAEVIFDKKSYSLSPFPSLSVVTYVGCGKEHAIFVTADGFIFTYGNGSRGQLGNGRTDYVTEPELLACLRDIRMVYTACGAWHTVALSDIGDVYVWGWNKHGQLGLPADVLPENVSGTPQKSPTSGSDRLCQKPHTSQLTHKQRSNIDQHGSNTVLDVSGTTTSITSHSTSPSEMPMEGHHDWKVTNSHHQITDNPEHAAVLHDRMMRSDTITFVEKPCYLSTSNTTKTSLVTWENKDIHLCMESEERGPPIAAVAPITPISTQHGLTCSPPSPCVQAADEVQNESIVNVQFTPRLIEHPQMLAECKVIKVACGSQHTLLLTEHGVVFSSGWNEYGQLGQGDRLTRDCFSPVSVFTDYICTDIFASNWGSIFVIESSCFK